MDTLAVEDLEREGLKVGKAPPLGWRAVTVGQRSPVRRTVRVPKGIDPGFAYAPGRVFPDKPRGRTGPPPEPQSLAVGNAIQQRMRQGAKYAPMITVGGILDALTRPDIMAAHLSLWKAWLAEKGFGSDKFHLSMMEREVISWLRREKGIVVAAADISIARGDRKHIRRETKKARISDEDWASLPYIIRHREAVLYRRNKNRDALVYVYTPRNPDEPRKGKIIVRVNFERKKDGKRVFNNEVKTAGYVQAGDLSAKSGYELIAGEVK